MTYRLFLDDERFPPDDGAWLIARTVDEARAIVEANGIPAFISFDHDLGPGPNAMQFAHWLADHVLDHSLSLDGFDFYVHSQNPVGRDNIQSFIEGLLRATRADS